MKKTIITASVLMFVASAYAGAPAMGWNSWDYYGCTINEQQAKEEAKAQAEKLLPHGYNVFTVDIDWYCIGPVGHVYPPDAPLAIDGFSRYIPAPDRFPGGFKALGDYVHSLGLKFGIHIMRGISKEAVRRNLPIMGTEKTAAEIAKPESVCEWNPRNCGVDMTKKGAQEYYDSIFRLYAEWGVDFVKVDDISRPYDDTQLLEIEAISKAIKNCGREMTLSLSPGDTPVERGAHVTQWANQWRISDDFWDKWQPLKEMLDRLDKWTPYRRDGHWPDADMIPFGLVSFGRECRFSLNEQQLLMTLWCIARSPLILGCTMKDMDDFTLALVTNDEVLAANQKSGLPRQLRRDGDLVVWVNDDLEGGRYVALFNASEKTARVGVTAEELGFAKDAKLRVRNLWTRRNVKMKEPYSALAPHSAAFFRVTPANP